MLPEAPSAGNLRTSLTLSADDPAALALVAAIQTGDLESLRRFLAGRPELAGVRIKESKGGVRTLLHVVTDWPGYFPNGPAVVSALIRAGCDPNLPIEGSWHKETPLHWAASSDDVEVARALIDGGASLEASGASIAGGTPLDDAVAYGCWRVARLLVERGARVYKLWHAAALGRLAQVEEFCAADPLPSAQDVTDAFWQACHGGHRRTAEYLLSRGATLNGAPSWDKTTTPLDAANLVDTGRQALLAWLRDQGAQPCQGSSVQPRQQ